MEPPQIDPVKQISKNYLEYLFEYRDGDLYWKNTPNRHAFYGKKAGRLAPTGYISIEIDNKPYQAHRLIWIMHNGGIDSIIDHIDGNRSNNKIENLRSCDKFQNAHNRKKCKKNTTGIKGVRLRNDSGKYEARIVVRGKRHVLGSYNDLEFAELVMQMAREKYHGEFANHG